MNRLRQLREEKGKTLREVSEDLKMSFSNIATLERGDSQLKEDTAIIFAKYYNVSIDYLFCNSNIRTIPEQIKLDQYQLALYNASKPLSNDEKTQILDFVNYIKNKKPSGDGK